MDISHLHICSSHHAQAGFWLVFGGSAGCALHCVLTGAAFLSGGCGLHRLANGVIAQMTRHALPALLSFASLYLLTFSGVSI